MSVLSEPPQESEDETPVDRENNGDESGEAEDDGHRETISGTSSRETHSNHDNNHNMSEAQNGDGIMGSETYGNSEAIDIQAAVKPNQRDPVLADSEVEVDEGYGSDDEEGDGADPAVNEESGVVDTDEVEVEKDEGFEDDVLNEDAGGGSYDAVIDALDDNHRNPVPLDEKALWDTAKEDPESASNTIILPSGTASPAFQDVSPTATDTNLLSTHNASPLSPGPTTGPFETITEESEDPDDYLLNNRPDYYVDPYGADTVSPVPSTDKELTGTGDATGSYEKFADSPSTATTVPGESDDDDSLEAVWPRPEDMNNDSFDEIPDTLEVTGDGTNDVDYDVGERSSTTSSPPPTSVTDESRRS
ncbi:hypothetical protein BCR39DRAFT_239822 [Naematelia encephala]|uniref:Uncharacterized protein n=1 Tax=Naematelia encephala TaxID=71784 RepID=A0A1Y2AZA8_9TREE|nr:hypothetical protein BCR39DRAFT_239822 [Naematelia encephala]